ncbi:MAG TPA: integrase arm-type DNA-binding domain-containing protein [Acetobacteraceae bacterium]|nr:integrase arm-type DNA-binding domain-containing protein [Acetobacteraceae bacterium]
MRITSEGPIKITKATIEAAWRRKKPDHRLIVRDKDCRGLALIVNPTTMTWSYAYRPRGTDPATGRRWPNQTITLGNPETHSPDDARAGANRIKGQAAAGADPAAERKSKAEAMRRERSITLGRLIETYAAVLPTRPKMRGTGNASPAYVAEELSQCRLALADLEAQDMPVVALGLAELRRLLDRLGAAPSVARKRFGALSRFLDWCQDAGQIAANPCTLVARARRPRAVQSRVHYLTPAELARLWEAAGRLAEPVRRDFARFLIAMPCRRGEAAAMDWSHLDLDAAEWRQPGHMTKNREPHRLHLHPLALDVLRERHKATGGKGLVFPAPRAGGVLTAFSGIKAAVVDATAAQGEALNGWAWHDTRRSFATALGEAGVSETVADAVLNHRQAATRGGVLGVYQRGSRWPEQMRAMELWGRLLAEAITGAEEPANVVPMVARAG